MTGQPFSSELAALSWNFLVLIVDQDVSDEGGLLETARADTPVCTSPGVPAGCKTDYEVAREVYLDPNECSLVSPELCPTFRTLMGAIGLQRNIRRAAGNSAHGRRTFLWHGGSEIELAYQKKNVLGFAMDFTEDVTKASFGLEATWSRGNPVPQNDAYDGVAKVDRYNLTISVDRPTFINFLNPNRTFFINAQFFMEYLSGWEKGIVAEGPWNFLGTLAVSTGYFQDRLAPSIVSVYDVNSQSGALLTGISYRFTVNFSAAIGMSFFYGKPDFVDEPIVGLSTPSNRNWDDASHLYQTGREGGLALLRDRDEFWARLRYTF